MEIRKIIYGEKESNFFFIPEKKKINKIREATI